MDRLQQNVWIGCLVLATLLTNLLYAGDYNHPKIRPELSAVLNSQQSSTDYVRVYIKLNDRMHLSDLQNMHGYLPRKERQKAVVNTLRNHAYATQGPVLAHLENAQLSKNGVRNIRNIWAINVIAFEAQPQVVMDIALGYNEIEAVFYDPIISDEDAQDDEGISAFNAKHGITTPPLFAPQIGLTLINAPLVWAEGDSGQGILVANCDSGTDWTHPDLVNNIWNNLGEDADGDGRTIEFVNGNWVYDPGDANGVDDDGNGYIDDYIGYDFGSNDNDPQDSGSHGTSTAGQICGDGTNGTQTGVAPKAKIMICRVAGGGQTDWWAAYQYAFTMGVDVTTSSYSLKWISQPDYAGFRNMTDMELAAGVIHTNSTGNQGAQGQPGCTNSYPVPYNISTPGNSPGPWQHPDQGNLIGSLSSVIGCGNVVATTDVISSGSGLGPAAWENIQQRCPTYPNANPPGYMDYPFNLAGAVEPDSIGLLKPDVSAPGSNTTSTVPGGGYSGFGGTSSATPHTAGVVALLLSVNPTLEPADISRILQTTGIEKGAPGKDERYGAGRIDAYQAYLQARAEFGLPNTATEANAYSDYNTPSSIALSWTNPIDLLNGEPLSTDAFSVRVLRNGAEVGVVPGTSSTFTDSGLNDGQQYFYELIVRVDSTGRESDPARTDWFSGGAKQPAAPTGLSISGNQSQVTVSWTNSSLNIDGTPMDDLAGINLYQNGALVTTFTRSSSDTSTADQDVYQNTVAGYYDWSISAVDNETPQNESELTSSVPTPLSLPLSEAFSIAGEPNPGVWINENTDVNDRADNPPTDGLALNLNGTPSGGDVITMRPIDLSGFSEALFDYYYQPQGTGNAPEEGDSLRVHFRNDQNEWILVKSYPGSTVQPFQQEIIEIASAPSGSGSYFHSQFQVRFSSIGGAGNFPNDDWFVDDVRLTSNLVGIDDPLLAAPTSFEVSENYPNPFNPSTTISYQLPERSDVKLFVYNMLGQKVRTLVNGEENLGFYSVEWNGQSDVGLPVASGVYIMRFEASGLSNGQRFNRSSKMILLK
ncbi:MAG: S8 family serine peptidase [Calditrichia bacterium]